MGLIKAAGAAISSTMHDQWKDVISCENMDNNTLMIRKTTDTGVISKKSIIRVMPGQCAVIIQNGRCFSRRGRLYI
jgi:membrane protease subunit (stomatin/prohibitin family)